MLPTRFHDPKKTRDIIKTPGDHADDVVDALRYALPSYVTATDIHKPAHVRFAEEINSTDPTTAFLRFFKTSLAEFQEENEQPSTYSRNASRLLRRSRRRRQARKQLKEIGWTKGLELAKLARRDKQRFDCATWLHRAKETPKEQFKQEVEKELTGRETEPWEIIYFKLYQSQMPVIDRAIETAALMLGSDRSRGYCLEMICADFLAGANLDHGDPEILLFSMTRFFRFLPAEQRQAFLGSLSERSS